MRKEKWIICITIIAAFFFYPTASIAGTFIGGAKGWYASWESSVLKWFEKDIAAGFQEMGMTLNTKRDPGSGYLLGPLLSYQTDDAKWSFSFAPMIFSSFSQDWSGTASGMALQSTVELERKDYDLAANYSLFKNMKVFVGYKHQVVNMDFTLTYDTSMGPNTFYYTLESTVMMPTAGVGFAYPISDKLAGGLQLGLLYSIPTLKMNVISGGTSQTTDLDPYPSLGFNGEVSLNYQPMESFFIQLGYRYQIFQLQTRSEQRWEKTKSNDITHGIVLSVLYVF